MRRTPVSICRFGQADPLSQHWTPEDGENRLLTSDLEPLRDGTLLAFVSVNEAAVLEGDRLGFVVTESLAEPVNFAMFLQRTLDR